MRLSKPSLFLILHGFMLFILHNLPSSFLNGSQLLLLIKDKTADNWIPYLILWIIAVATTSVLSLFPDKPKTNILPRITSLDKLRALTWREFEEVMAEYYIYNGYQAEVIGGSGGDGGIDLWLKKGGKKYIVQCKHWKNNVGVAIIREMFGVMVSERAKGVMIVTTGAFTKEAISFAEGKPIELIDGQQLVERVASMKTRKKPEKLTKTPRARAARSTRPIRKNA